ncbi:MAG: Ig-like domain-containing protein [Arachidicoccus sp.]|nr:Ig-like domain-containing protein [Arachidicoccus sp.]
MRKLLYLLFFITNISYAQVNLMQGLMAYYPFNGNASDVSGNNNNPVFNNAILTTDKYGNANSAYHFNGINNYMRIPNSPTINFGTSMSICVMVRPTGFYTGQCHGNMILGKLITDYQSGNYSLRFSDTIDNCNGSTSVKSEFFYGPDGNAKSKAPIILNEWYSIVFTTDGVTTKLYVNCQLVASYPTSPVPFTNIYDLYFGRMNNSTYPYWLNGDLDEIRLYNRALNYDEVKAYGNCCVPTFATIDSTICQGQSYLGHNATGTYTDTLVNATGCDSIVTLKLTVLTATSSSTDTIICPSVFPFVWNGLNITKDGAFTAHLSNSIGCDSAATLNVTLRQITSSSTDTIICPSVLPFVWNGLNITKDGAYTAHLSNSIGCDSAATLNVTLRQITSSSTDTIICPSVLPFVWNGLNITKEGSYTAHLSNSIGCDSNATLNVTLRAIISSSKDTSICLSGLPFVWNGLSVTKEGSYTAHLSNSIGCDSNATLNVKIPPTSSTSNITIQPSDLPYTWNGLIFKAAGSQTVQLTSSLGCDSTATLILTVINKVDSVVARTKDNVPAFITSNSGTLQLIATVYPLDASQQVTWSIIPTTGSATIDANGLVTAVSGGNVWAKATSVQDNTKSDSILINICSTKFAVNIFPNPAQNYLNLGISVPCGMDIYKAPATNICYYVYPPVIQVFNSVGTVVLSQIFRKNNTNIFVGKLVPGVYYIQLNAALLQTKAKFIKR